MYAETVLFVDHYAGQVFKRNVFDKQGMGADNNVDFAGGQIFQQFGSAFAFSTPGQQLGADADVFAQRLDCLQMLFGQNLGRRHNCRLRAAFDRIQHCQQRDNGFAAADISLQKPQHTIRRSLIGADFF